MKIKLFILLVVTILASCGGSGSSSDDAGSNPENHSIARLWNELLLTAIREDFARPTVHARNLFHHSAAMYDVWAVFDDRARPFLLGQTVSDGFSCALEDISSVAGGEQARLAAISHASYRIIEQRFSNSPGSAAIMDAADHLMGNLSLDRHDRSLDYQQGSAAALGNYIASCYLDWGLVDGANEQDDYANQFYRSVNRSLDPALSGNPRIDNLDRWQPLAIEGFIDQAGNPVNKAPEFLGPEWGAVTPFAMDPADAMVNYRSGNPYKLYFDPGAPPAIEQANNGDYQWSFAMVATWSSHLDPADGVMVDISPASLGNNPELPTGFSGHRDFYSFLDGGDSSRGYAENPATGRPYTTQLVPRGDYARVLAEFWADGPDSETPPGHWFVILNTVADHPQVDKRYRGQGQPLAALEWDIKAYFTLAGAMHDSAISAWGLKGWYDFIRPISALRAMADLGQSSDPAAASYNSKGMPLELGFVELVDADDELSGVGGEHVGKIKVRAWRGPGAIADPAIDSAGVGWILMENWWPYQRPSFVTPPFAGYVSGHSTYSRAAAEVLTAFTGDAFFPGGMSGFEVRANDFLVFERGPSVAMTLQWATYRDASDQCSLSRIWGGIHPPADDIAGRIIGEQIGLQAFVRAEQHFSGQ